MSISESSSQMQWARLVLSVIEEAGERINRKILKNYDL